MPEFPRYAGLVALHGAYKRSVDVSRGGLQRACPERRVQQRHRAERTARSLQYRSPEWRREAAGYGHGGPSLAFKTKGPLTRYDLAQNCTRVIHGSLNELSRG